MGYCLKEDVAADFKDITFDTNSSVKDSEVDSWIDEASAYMDTFLSSRYIVPVTGTQSLLVLKSICIYIVSDRVRNVLYTKTGVAEKNQDTKATFSYSRNPRKDLTMIQDGEIKLIDAQVLSVNIGFDTGCKDEPVFNTSKDMW